jgi:lactoylglutathione lyase
MKYLHTMIRVKNIDESLKFFCDGLGLKETRRMENEKGRFTLVFLAAPNDEKAEIELTYNWDGDELGEGSRILVILLIELIIFMKLVKD